MLLRYKYFGTFRLLLAIMVVLNHAWPLAASEIVPAFVASIHLGSSSVLAFFVLSGLVLTEAGDAFYQGIWAAFALNRALKIVPPFLGALGISILVHSVFFSRGLLDQAVAFEGVSPFPVEAWSFGNFVANLLSVVPGVGAEGQYLFVRYIWAIAVEVAFYTALALWLYLCPKEPRQWILAAISIIGSTAYLFAFAGGLFDGSTWADAWFYGSFAPLFLLGCCIYKYSTGWGWKVALIVLLGPSLVRAALLISGVNVFHDALPFYGTIGIGTFVGMLIVLVVLSQVDLPNAFRHVDQLAGDLSYALYLNHYTVLVFGIFPPSVRGMPIFWLSIGISLLVAAALAWSIERPIARARASIRRHKLS